MRRTTGEARAAAPNDGWRGLAARSMIRGGGAPPAPLANALFVLFLGGLLAYGGAFAWHMLGRFDLVNLIDTPEVNRDDAFYYFQVAWHLAEGKFSTFDGGITRTNGYHPLWLLLITPFYWLFDKETALFAIKALEIMLIAGGVALVAVAARLARLPWILLFAALPALYRQQGMLMGMESAAGLFMLGLFFFAIVLFARDPARRRWPLAVAAFALPWVRLEYAAISLAATAALLLVEWSWQGRPPPGARARSLLACKAAGPLLAAGASLLMYFGYNGAVFGGIVPVSAATKQRWSQDHWEAEGGYDLTRNVHDFLQTSVFDDELRVVLEVFVLVLLVWWFARRSRSREDWLLLAFLVGLFGLAAGHLAKFVQSVLTVHPYWGSYNWYFVPAYLMGVIMIPARCCVAIWFIRRFIGPRLPRASGILILGIVVAGAGSLYAASDFAAPFRFVDRHGETTSIEYSHAHYMGAKAMNRVLPEGSVVGAWASGVLGYFSHFPVVNLDGLVNSYDYMRARKKGISKHFRSRHFGITHFTDIRTLPKPLGLMLFEGPPIRLARYNFQQFKIWPADPHGAPWSGASPSDWLWERMEPHFGPQTDGIGFFVDGRLAQAFARDCAPDELAVWSWSRGGEETSPGRWTPTRTGLCVSARVLPRDASDVRVAGMTVGEHLSALGDRQPAIRSEFDVYLVEDRLIYVKGPCGQADAAAPFFLHVDPVSPDDLPQYRKPYGFDNLPVRFDRYGTRLGGTCWMEVLLPRYEFDAIRTGQYLETEGGSREIWKGDIRFE